jgi:hypothetical protein
MTSRYAELQVTSHFSFLRGASSCEELFAHERQRRIILAAGMLPFREAFSARATPITSGV